MYFLALACPPALDEKILRFKNWMKEHFGCVVALRAPAHITLVPPFWLDEAREPELFKTLQSFSSNAGDIEIHVNGFSHFGKRVLFVTVDNNPGLQLIKTEAGDYFSNVFPEIKKDKRPFHPHITIANRDMKPSHFEKAWEYFSGKELNEFCRIRSIFLYKLVMGKWVVAGERRW